MGQNPGWIIWIKNRLDPDESSGSTQSASVDGPVPQIAATQDKPDEVRSDAVASDGPDSVELEHDNQINDKTEKVAESRRRKTETSASRVDSSKVSADTTQWKDLSACQPGATIPWNVDKQRDPLPCYIGEDWVVEQEKDVVFNRIKSLIKSGDIASVPDQSEIHEVMRL